MIDVPAGRPRPDRVPVLSATNIHKRYGHVVALEGASISIYEREVVALIGDNGAGKSSLVSVLCGTAQPDDGQLALDGRPITFSGPRVAREAGISTTFQDLALATDLDAAANMYLGRELTKGPGWLGLLDNRAMRAQTEKLIDDLGIRLKNPRVRVANLSGGQRQCIAVARATAWATRLVVLDEPSASLGVVQAEAVRDMIRRVSRNGLSVLLVSHNMPEVLELADRIVVLRLGRTVAEFDATASPQDLVAAITGSTHQAAGEDG